MALAPATGSAESVHATVVTSEIDDNLVLVKLVMEGIQPVMFGDKTKAKNATVNVKLEPGGFTVSATVESPKQKFTNYKRRVWKLPSQIDVKQSTWKVKKNMIAMKLRKCSPCSWVPYLSAGLDQAPEESGDEEEQPFKTDNFPAKGDSFPFKADNFPLKKDKSQYKEESQKGDSPPEEDDSPDSEDDSPDKEDNSLFKEDTSVSREDYSLTKGTDPTFSFSD